NQFSTTTKLKGIATFVLGSNSYSGDYRTGFAARDYSGFPLGSKYANEAAATNGATTFNYDVQLNFDTSFTGKDLLRTRLRAGNFADSAFFGNAPVGLTGTEIGFEENCGTGVDCGDVVAINRLFYQFPIGSSFTATIGGRVRQDDMLALWPSVYPADTILDIFTYAGAPGAYSMNLGAGAGLWWKSGNFSVSANYVSANGDVANPATGGIGTSGSTETGTFQIAYSTANLGLAAVYNYSAGGAGLYGGNGTPLAVAGFGLADSVNSVGISGYWQPSTSGWFPSVSGGWGLNSYNSEDDATNFDGANSQSWYLGLQWADAFIKGNTLGMAVGEPTFITHTANNDFKANDGNYAWEWWYKFQVTDNISVTPALYYLSAPLGQIQKDDGGNSFTNFGGLVKTTFKF
ncbi:MAG: iron uptake porin, partial [Synechococcaceae cyanobacterium ELA263]